jgi:trans-aconitate 2-methyltransferase
MTEWNASEYARISTLQAAMAEEVLALLDLKGNERILDVGCGNGKTTAEIAARVPQGAVVGVDASADMIAFAAAQGALPPNLQFAVADARHLPYQHEFDLVVSFNALHWIPDQDHALRSIRAAVKETGLAQLRLVPKGQRKSLEDVLEETRLSSRWSSYFQSFRDPYLHLTPEQYGELAKPSEASLSWSGPSICRKQTVSASPPMCSIATRAWLAMLRGRNTSSVFTKWTLRSSPANQHGKRCFVA